MNLYLAGGVSANLQHLWKDAAKRIGWGAEYEYLFGWESSHKEYESDTIRRGGHWILESFYSIEKSPWFPKILPALDGFMLDSGAYTFMEGSYTGLVDFQAYQDRYAEFINRNNIELFFNLDIESIIGIEKTERLRERLESQTGKKPIIVWHPMLGIDYFKKLCDSYPYLALGGMGREIPMNDYTRGFPWFINTAHKAGVKLHGLGYTNIEGLHKYNFDSVDSTAWLYGNRGGFISRFKEDTGYFTKIKSPPGYRLNSREAALYNYKEWQKFQKYARERL